MAVFLVVSFVMFFVAFGVGLITGRVFLAKTPSGTQGAQGSYGHVVKKQD